MRGLIQDLRFALRQLGRAPSFAVTAVLTLMLGIGANTAIFSIVNNFVLKPMPVERSEQVAEIVLGQNKTVLLPFLSWQEYKAVPVCIVGWPLLDTSSGRERTQWSRRP